MFKPYICTSGREFVQQASGFDNEQGVAYRQVGGEHAIWAARVPFLPSLLSEDFVRLGKDRIQLTMSRQFRFIYDLSRAREHRATFELRFISTPSETPGQPNTIEIVFLGKVFSQRRGGGQELALQLWDKFVNNFLSEDPYNYPLELVTDPDEFARYYAPLVDLDPANLLEIRKFEDMPVPSAALLGRVARKGDYIAHPFVPSVSFTPMSRFIEALAFQDQKCLVGVSLRPTRMYDQEIHNVSFAIGQFKRTATEDDDVTEEYIRTRSVIGVQVYQKLMAEREHLMMVRVHVAGQERLPYGLAEALGSELMDNANNPYPTQWVAARPQGSDEEASALHNLRWLEHDFWGETEAAPPLARLRYLACAREASGAFRLPVPPESGYMPGVLVKSEPFVAPADELDLRREARANLDDEGQRVRERRQAAKVRLGQIYHRGKPTPQFFSVDVPSLTRHALIGGSTGSGKTTTLQYVLSQLWREHGIPFLVLYPVDKPDYRNLRRYLGLDEELLIFTLGDEGTSAFRFNPFEVPDGFRLRTHISRLMRVFRVAFSLHDPLPMVYREALRQVYRAKGWDPVRDKGKPGRAYPVMAEFYDTIRQITDSLQYGREVQDNVRQASVIRIGDLLENAGPEVNVRRSMDFGTVLNRPTVMELGRVGSMQDTALLMGFLLTRLSEEIERHPRPGERPHITVVEEAHQLMAESAPAVLETGNPRQLAGEDFGNVLSEVRGHGEGIMVAEQMPTQLVKGAIGNTYLKVMHWLEDAPSFELFSSVMNLNEQQQDYVRTLGPGFAVVRSPYGRPVHIKVPEQEDQEGYETLAEVDNSDQGIRAAMVARRERLGLADVPAEAWDASLAATQPGRGDWRVSVRDLAWLLGAPMRACLLCEAMHRTGQCLYRSKVRRRLGGDPEFDRQCRAELEHAVGAADSSDLWARANALGKQIEARLGAVLAEDSRDMVYCAFAQYVDALLDRDRATQDDRAKRGNVLLLLRQFADHYDVYE